MIQTDKYEEALRQGISRLWAGEDPKAILDDVAKQWDQITQRWEWTSRRRYTRLGRQVGGLSEGDEVRRGTTPLGSSRGRGPGRSAGAPAARPHERRDFSARALVAPSIFVLLLIGIFPLVYLLVVSFQNITMTEIDTGFLGLRNYRCCFATAGCGKRCCTL